MGLSSTKTIVAPVAIEYRLAPLHHAPNDPFSRAQAWRPHFRSAEPLPENEGFEIIVNGVVRSFRDQREAAYDAARYLKIRHPKAFVEVLNRVTGTELIVFEDGRITFVSLIERKAPHADNEHAAEASVETGY